MTIADVLADTTPAATLRADLANMRDFWSRYGRAPGRELHETPDVTWVVTGIHDALLNGIFHFTATDADADRAIASILDHFRGRDLPLQWMVTSSMRPSDLSERLAAHGMTHLFDAPGMAIDLATMADPPLPEGLTIHRVRDRPMLEAWDRVGLTCFEVAERLHPEVIDLEESLGLDWSLPSRRYLAMLDGKTVATSMVHYHAGVAGIYFVATLPEARGRGIGAAITVAPLKEARALGYRIGVLQASPMGLPVYKRLGFQEHARYQLYVAGE